MINLILVRHAKSDWNFDLTDKMRPIQERGIIDSNLVSKEFIDFLPNSYTFISSTAQRARQTALIFAENFKYPNSNIHFIEELYTFDENQLEQVIKSLKNDLKTVILFGHNPALTNFVNTFGTIYIDNLPTTGLVWLQFDTDDWGKINKGKAIKIIFPKNLK